MKDKPADNRTNRLPAGYGSINDQGVGLALPFTPFTFLCRAREA